MSFSQRLQRALKRAGMTPGDAHHWFARPRSTVTTWCKGRSPRGPIGTLAGYHLALLEKALKEKIEGLPVPAEMNYQRRPAYVRGLRDEIERRARRARAGLPGMRAAG